MEIHVLVKYIQNVARVYYMIYILIQEFSKQKNMFAALSFPTLQDALYMPENDTEKLFSQNKNIMQKK